MLCQSVFLSNPVQESDLNNYYTNNYLPYKGAAAWKYKLFVTKSTKFRFKRVKVVANNTKKKKIIFYSGCGL
jgi:hypothetical protein